ncbi:Transcriptional regulator, TetR family [Petrimonas sp. IBARAKI]|jgi:AcrR family transcriptional regulator|nr:Transcriptional regulator, TetR family [Petrimonas sp. IBARAKI]
MTKKEQIIQTAEDLFLHFGFKRLTISEICDKSGISRKTFYSYFGSKDDLVQQIVEAFMENAFNLFENILNDNTLTFAEKLEKSILMKYDMGKKWSFAFFSDLLSDEKISVYYHSLTGRSASMVRQMLESAQKNEEIDPDLNIDYIIWLLKKQSEHLNDKELLRFFTDIEDMIRQMTRVFVYGISTPPKA